MHHKIAALYKDPSTIFTYRDVALLWRERNSANLKARLSYYVKQGTLIRLRRGVFAKPAKPGSPRASYDPLELGTKLMRPAYISFETVLAVTGMIPGNQGEEPSGEKLAWRALRQQTTFYLAGRRSKTIRVDGRAFIFRKIKDKVIFNRSGLKIKNHWAMASQERAFLDMLYLRKNYYFSSFTGLNWQKCFQLVSIYDNRQLLRRLKHYHRVYGPSAKSKKPMLQLDGAALDKMLR